MSPLLNVAVALLPVLLFLALLFFLDSFKLVAPRSVLLALIAGAAAAAAAVLVNDWLAAATGIAPRPFSRYVAPLVEESLKALWVVALLRRGRIGFLVDGAILGFAVGAGFALVENVEYLLELAEPRVVMWLVRGLGTAVLHGATTAILAILAKALTERHPERPATALVPAFLAAVFVHSLYNHFLLPPVPAAAVLLVVLPLLLVAVFERSERKTRYWLGTGLDTDLDLVDAIVSGQALETRTGQYLRELKAHFPGEVVADMLCLLRIQAELAIRAKGLLLAREAGLEVPIGEEVRANLRELRYLERSIGRTGLLALKPVLPQTARDLWQVYFLEEAGGKATPR